MTFSARADAYVFTSFTFSAADGAVFTAAPVPEPSIWLLMAGGLGAVGWQARRRLSA